MSTKINFPDKNTGDSFSAAEATEIKTVVNSNADLLDTKVDKVTGKQLSTEDYTTADKIKLGTATPLLQAETIDYVNRLTAVSRIIPSALINAIDTFFVIGKKDGWLPLLDEIWRPMGADLTAAMVKLKYASGCPSSCTNVGFVEADYSQETGLGTGSTANGTKYLTTGFTPSTVGIDSRNITYGYAKVSPDSMLGSGIASFIATQQPSGTSVMFNGDGGVGLAQNWKQGDNNGMGVKSCRFGTNSWECFFDSASCLVIGSAATQFALDTELNYFRSRYNGTTYYAASKCGGGYIGRDMDRTKALSLSRAFYDLNLACGSFLQVGGVAVFFGDSNTSGRGLASNLRFSTKTAQLLGAREYNLGVTTSELRRDQSLGAGGFTRYLDFSKVKKNNIISMYGTNDMHTADVTTNGDATIIADFKTKYTTMINSWKAEGLKILIISPVWIFDTNDTKLTAWTVACKEVAQAGQCYFLDGYHLFLDTGNPSSYFNSDGVHLNASGADLLAKAVAQCLSGITYRALSLDFPSIAVDSSSDLTLTMYGATVGMSVIVNTTGTPVAGLVYQGFVSATDVVTVRAINTTSAAIDPAAQTIKVTIIS